LFEISNTVLLSQQILSKLSQNFKKRCNIKPTDVWYPDFSRKDITDMSKMFGYSDLKDLDLTHWNTSNVTNMREMFREAQNIPESIGNWNTSNAKNMYQMFYEAQNIPESVRRKFRI
jgi:surface protein